MLGTEKATEDDPRACLEGGDGGVTKSAATDAPIDRFAIFFHRSTRQSSIFRMRPDLTRSDETGVRQSIIVFDTPPRPTFKYPPKSHIRTDFQFYFTDLSARLCSFERHQDRFDRTKISAFTKKYEDNYRSPLVFATNFLFQV